MRVRGTVQVVRFNWPKLLAGAAAALCGAAVARRGPPRLRRLAALGATAAAWTTVVSLLASWWVYDASELRHWRFPARVAGLRPRRVLLVTAGFDEVSSALRDALGDARIDVVDVLGDARADEASIRRARRLFPAAARRVEPDDVGGGGRYDMVLFAQSIHELRAHRDRAAAIRSALGALTGRGAVVLVEHLRDAANVLAYGPGAWHFHTAGAWRRAIAEAGGVVDGRLRITPFVAAWAIRPAR